MSGKLVKKLFFQLCFRYYKPGYIYLLMVLDLENVAFPHLSNFNIAQLSNYFNYCNYYEYLIGVTPTQVFYSERLGITAH